MRYETGGHWPNSKTISLVLKKFRRFLIFVGLVVENFGEVGKILKINGPFISRSSFLYKKYNFMKVLRHHKFEILRGEWSIKILKKVFRKSNFGKGRKNGPKTLPLQSTGSQI